MARSVFAFLKGKEWKRLFLSVCQNLGSPVGYLRDIIHSIVAKENQNEGVVLQGSLHSSDTSLFLTVVYTSLGAMMLWMERCVV